MNIAITATIREQQKVSSLVKGDILKTEKASKKNQVEEAYKPSKQGLDALLVAAAEELKKSKEKEASSEATDQIKAMKIAHNIMRGKIVPAKDEDYLIQFDAKLYQVAKNIGAMEEQTEKVDSELEDKESDMQRQLDGIMLEEEGIEITDSVEPIV